MNREMDIAKFYGKIFEDTDLREKLKSEMKKVKTESELKRLIEKEIIPIAQKMGENFTVEDLVNFEKESINKISLEDLENISGGISLKPVILGGGLLALSLFGVKVNTADAAIPNDVIKDYNINVADDNKQQLEKDVMEVEDSSEPIPMTDVLKTEAIKEDAQQETTDEEYIMTALNPRDALAMNLSGTTENFRFYNGDIDTIAVGKPGLDGVPRLEYNRYSGEGSANLMTSLFPSSPGELNTEGGKAENHPFSEDCKPTPELVASIVACVHNYIRPQENFSKVLDKLNIKDFEYYNQNKSKYEELLKKLQEIKGNTNISKKEIKKINKGLESLKFTKISGTKTPEIVYNLLKAKNEILESLKDIKSEQSLPTIKYLLKNIHYMIKNQEQDDQHKDRILPKYTTERMIMCYFLKHFHKKEDLDKFYAEVRKNIHGDKKVSENNEQSGNYIRHDESMKAVLSKIRLAENSPYKDKTQQNGPTKAIKKNGATLKFENVGFQDCADITARHFLNLMGYKDANKWDYFWNRAEKGKIKNNAEVILNAIKSNGELPNLSLKEKLQAFIHYQSQVGADDTSLETRSFWNAVVSHMDTPADSDLYSISYNKGNNKIPGNEVKSGFVNMLKLTYNLLHALGKDCGEAKNAINKMINEQNEDNLKAAMNAILKIFNHEAPVLKLEKIIYENNEIYGKLTVNSADKEFLIGHRPGHAYVDFNPLKFDQLEEGEQSDFVKSDPIAQLLAEKFGVQPGYLQGTSKFNMYYVGSDLFDSEEKNLKRYANFETLRFLKEMQGDGDNVERIERGINKYINIKDSNINIVDDKNRNKQSISDFIFFNYVAKFGLMEPFFRNEDRARYNVKESYLHKWCQSRNLIGKDDVGNEYMCLKYGDAVKVFPFWSKDNCPTIPVIPSKVKLNGEDKAVSGWASGSFTEDTDIKTIKISIDNDICKYEFSGCRNLENVEISGKADRLIINKELFYECEKIKSIEISADVNDLIICGHTFANLHNLEDLKLSGSANDLKILGNAFLNCKSLKTVELPNVNGVVYIENGAFRDCVELEELRVPEKVKKLVVGEETFINCPKLKGIRCSKELKVEFY